jgi:UDP-glucose 4-epimerase
MVQGFSLGDIDLSEHARSRDLLSEFDHDTLVIACAAIKRQEGDSPDTYLRNMAITVTMAKLLAERSVGRLVYLSSSAVYGEDIENRNITEATPIHPRSYYGLHKANSEWIFRRVVSEGAASSLLILRPATIYGPGESSNSYGPVGFLNAARRDEPILLWGDGSELREFVHIKDAADAIARLALGAAEGVVNLVSGKSHTFRDIVDEISSALGRAAVVHSRLRSKDRVDNQFDATRLMQLLPGFQFTPLADGVCATLAALEKESA